MSKDNRMTINLKMKLTVPQDGARKRKSFLKVIVFQCNVKLWEIQSLKNLKFHVIPYRWIFCYKNVTKQISEDRIISFLLAAAQWPAGISCWPRKGVRSKSRTRVLVHSEFTSQNRAKYLIFLSYMYWKRAF